MCRVRRHRNGAIRSDSIEYRRENLCQSCCVCSKTALQMADSRLKILKNKNEIQIKQLRRELAQLLEAGTVLPMVNSRLKILKNKKEIQIKQLSRELAQLLEAGTVLPMVNSRLKILKNKKEIQIKQLRQELAQLLEAGNTPKIEFGWKRRQWLPMNSLASTANSLLFFRCYRVSKRLSDVPELSEIVKQFTTKYGKDLLRLLFSFVQILVYVDMISNLKVAYVLRKRQAPDVMNEMSEV
ncbi:hypothetical protein DY000_02041583 [Brassica cretica]|uniref:Uncharacterized protein n=1 Tax=Brassica cretica TaxID=69181 RepID=A0ABQ7BC37_BRACR|nr:hypothetical protein DY000_02041583 [Brassica cretica]